MVSPARGLPGNHGRTPHTSDNSYLSEGASGAGRCRRPLARSLIRSCCPCTMSSGRAASMDSLLQQPPAWLAFPDLTRWLFLLSVCHSLHCGTAVSMVLDSPAIVRPALPGLALPLFGTGLDLTMIVGSCPRRGKGRRR